MGLKQGLETDNSKFKIYYESRKDCRRTSNNGLKNRI
jgi:hypothetical protein